MNEQNSVSKKKLSNPLMIAALGAAATIVAAVVGSVLVIYYQNHVSKIEKEVQDIVSKREITLEVIDYLSKFFLKAKPIILHSNIQDSDALNKVLQHKENSFLAHQLTRYLANNYQDINFRELQSVLANVERRYSYAKIYEAAGLANIICENLTFTNSKNTRTIQSTISECKPSPLEGIDVTIMRLEHVNSRFKIVITRDTNQVICRSAGKSCSFWIDAGDRLESTSYKYLFLSEYIGYRDEYKKQDPIVAVSIIERILPDNSYYDYELNIGKTNNCKHFGQTKCKPFFDNDPSTQAQPPPPHLDNFDRAVLRACGRIRGRVTEREFEALISDYYPVLLEILPRKWKDITKDSALQILKRIWLSQNGFNHIFCGEWHGNSIQGLHFRGRYLQLQNEATGCFEESTQQEILDGVIYTIGVSSVDGNNCNNKKGYTLTQSARDLFRLGTIAYDICSNNACNQWLRYQTWYEKIFYLKSSEGSQDIFNQVICKAIDPSELKTIGLLTVFADVSPDKSYPLCDELY